MALYSTLIARTRFGPNLEGRPQREVGLALVPVPAAMGPQLQ